MKLRYELQYCTGCNGIALHWNRYTNKWVANYVDGGLYCDCSDEDLALAKGSIRPETRV